MNQKQREYALQRVNDIENARLCALKTKLTTPGVTLTLEQRAELIDQGKVRLKDKAREDKHTYWQNAFDFSQYEKEAVYDFEACKPLIAKIRAEAGRIKDQIMLGDAEEALSAIAAFENGEV